MEAAADGGPGTAEAAAQLGVLDGATRAEAAELVVMDSRRCFLALHASNAPCEDVASVTDVAVKGGGSPACLLALFDGHGGNNMAQYCVANLPTMFRRRYAPPEASKLDQLRSKFFAASPGAGAAQPQPRDTAAPALAGAFAEADDAWLTERATLSLSDARAGACALVCYVEGTSCVVGSAGDCRAVLGRRRPPSAHQQQQDSDGISLSQGSQGSARAREASGADFEVVAITSDHTAQNSSEIELVRARTSDPLPFRDKMAASRAGSASRVAGSLMVTRAMGDGYLKRQGLSVPPLQQHVPYITSAPEVSELQIASGDAFLVLASDGIWDNLDSEDVVRIVGRALDQSVRGATEPQQLAQVVVDASLEKVCRDHMLTRAELDAKPYGPRRRKLHDDMTVIVLCLEAGVAPAAVSPAVIELRCAPPDPASLAAAGPGDSASGAVKRDAEGAAATDTAPEKRPRVDRPAEQASGQATEPIVELLASETVESVQSVQSVEAVV